MNAYEALDIHNSILNKYLLDGWKAPRDAVRRALKSSAKLVSSGDEPNEYPNARGFYKCTKYIGTGGFEPRCVDNFPDKALHADPLIFAKSGDRHIESITYGENDVEPKILWYHYN